VTDADAALQARAGAARELIGSGELGPALALSYVVWPTAKLTEIPPPVEHDAETRQRALELVADGRVLGSGSARGGRPHKQTVGGWVKARRSAV
jgi:hypothetical protein